MPSPTLTSLSEFKTHLGISDTSEDAELTQWLIGVEEAVKRFCGRDFVSAAATEYYDGEDRELLPLRRRPLTAVASVHVDAIGYGGTGTNAFSSDSEWTVGERWFPRSLQESEENGSILVAIGGIWPKGRSNIKVVNTAGYTTIPEDLKLAIHSLGAVVRDSAESGKIKGGETVGRYAYSVISGQADGGVGAITARSILAHYTELNL